MQLDDSDAVNDGMNAKLAALPPVLAKLILAAFNRTLCREEMEFARDRLVNGIAKLDDTNAVVDGMKAELAALAPVLAAKSAATAELLTRVAADTAEAEVVKATVAKETEEVNVFAQTIKAMADDAKVGLCPFPSDP